MIPYILWIPYMSTLTVIHRHYSYPDVIPNHPKLHTFSVARYRELTDNINPELDGIGEYVCYYMSKFATSKYGDAIFGNYNKYMECGRRIDFGEEYNDMYNQLPRFYKKRLDDINDW